MDEELNSGDPERQDSSRSHGNKLYLTNNFSIISKYSASRANYYKDELLEKFISKCCPNVIGGGRTTLVNRGYAARMLAMDWAVSRAINNDQINCFIVLGSGYDMLPQRYVGKCHWIEIDLPEVIRTKSEYLKENWNQTGEIDCVSSQDLVHFPQLYTTLISCDLLDFTELANKLTHVLSPIRHECKRIAIINEVCLCYSEYNDVKRILQAICETVKEFCWQMHYIGYEQVRFSDKTPFSDIMLEHFQSLGHKLKYFPTQQQVRSLFEHQLGFNHVTVASMFQIYHNALFAETSQRRYNELKPFDEYEEMDIYLSHYALITGVRIFKSPNLDEITKSGSSGIDMNDLGDAIDDDMRSTAQCVSCPVRRFGHSSCALDDHKVLVMGGFGKGTLGEHRRLQECSIVNIQFGYQMYLNIDATCFARLDRMHAQICKISGSASGAYIFLSGGRQSSSEMSRIEENCPVICSFESNSNLTLNHRFNHGKKELNHIRWRHRLILFERRNIALQIGGLPISSSDSNLAHLRAFDFNAGKLGSYDLLANHYFDSSWDCFKRHSFGADVRDDNTFIMFGGLQATNNMTRDRPVDPELNIILCDIRDMPSVRSPFQMRAKGMSTSSYGMNVHFINEFQFVKLGGVSVQTGLPENFVELYDLRMSLECPLKKKLVPTHFEDAQKNCNSPIMLTNHVSLNLKSSRKLITIGGGGNYFTFGTHFNNASIVDQY